MCISMFAYLYHYLFVFTYLPIYLSICLFIHISIYWSIYLIMCVYSICICKTYTLSLDDCWLLDIANWWIRLYGGIMRELAAMTSWKSWRQSFAGTPKDLPVDSASGAVESDNVGTCDTKFTTVARQTMANRASEQKMAESVLPSTYGDGADAAGALKPRGWSADALQGEIWLLTKNANRMGLRESYVSMSLVVIS